MTGLHEALDDIAAEITPIDPPVRLAMRLGGKKRHRRRIAAITGTAGAMALSAVAIASIPALTGPASAPALTSGTARGVGIPLARPVLLESPQGSSKEYGDAQLVNAATLRLFHRLACTPVPSALSGVVTNDAWIKHDRRLGRSSPRLAGRGRARQHEEGGERGGDSKCCDSGAPARRKCPTC